MKQTILVVDDEKSIRDSLESLLESGPPSCYNGKFVTEFLLSIVAVIRVFFSSRADTALEILAPTSCRAQAQATSAHSQLLGPSVLGDDSRRVAALARYPGDRKT